jgi:hypothetical protein
MRIVMPNSFPVRVFAYVILAGGILSTAADFFTRPEFAVPTNMGVVIGNTALVLLGLVASSVGSVLKSLETRLDKLERRFDFRETSEGRK